MAKEPVIPVCWNMTDSYRYSVTPQISSISDWAGPRLDLDIPHLHLLYCASIVPVMSTNSLNCVI